MEKEGRNYQIRRLLASADRLEGMFLASHKDNQDKDGKIVDHFRQDWINIGLSMVKLAQAICLNDKAESQCFEDVRLTMVELTSYFKKQGVQVFKKTG